MVLPIWSGRDVGQGSPRSWRWDRLTEFTCRVKVEHNRLADQAVGVLARLPGGNAAGQVRDIRGPVIRRLLEDDDVLHGTVLPLDGHVNPACRRMLFQVPVATSSPA